MDQLIRDDGSLTVLGERTKAHSVDQRAASQSVDAA